LITTATPATPAMLPTAIPAITPPDTPFFLEEPAAADAVWAGGDGGDGAPNDGGVTVVERAVLAPGAAVERTVLAPGAAVERTVLAPGAAVERTVLAPGAAVVNSVVVVSVVVIGPAVVGVVGMARHSSVSSINSHLCLFGS